MFTKKELYALAVFTLLIIAPLVYFIFNYLDGCDKMMHGLAADTLLGAFGFAILVLGAFFIYFYYVMKLCEKIYKS